MCFKHSCELFVAAYGCLLDLTGKEYLRRSKIILARSRQCSKCIAKAEKSLARR
jgi:hypothetical protein